jgi:hypothetical protein
MDHLNDLDSRQRRPKSAVNRGRYVVYELKRVGARVSLLRDDRLGSRLASKKERCDAGWHGTRNITDAGLRDWAGSARHSGNQANG